jgi:hypothetical protein
MPKTTVVEVPPEEHVQMLAAVRRARYGSLLALHILWLCAAGRTPTAIAAAHLCSRSSVYRTVRASRKRTLDWDHAAQGRLLPPLRPTVLLPTLRRSRVALLQATPRTSGWWRTRWRCAALAPRARLGVDARHTRGQRRRSPPRRALGPQPLCLRAAQRG